MSKWLLYAVISMGGTPAIDIHEFDTEEQCKTHLTEINKRFNGWGSTSHSYCMEK